MNINIRLGDSENLLQDITNVVGPSLVILLFIIERIISSSVRRREQRIGWYYKIVIEPYLSKITTFFDNTAQNFENSFFLLKNSSNLSHTQFLILKAVEGAKFSKDKRILELEIISLIRKINPKIVTQLTKVLQDIEDDFTTALGSNSYTDTEIEKFKEKLYQNKMEFWNALYVPISQ